jgi:hydroxyacylglutathione hydrolase
MLYCGDTLFAAGCGRLFEGTPKQMHDSLSRLMKLPDDTRVYCGHEYTVSNVRFARAVEPDNGALRELEARARKQRDQDQPTLPSTIAQEKATNPFVRVREPAVIDSASRHAGRPLSSPVDVLGALREWKNAF